MQRPWWPLAVFVTACLAVWLFRSDASPGASTPDGPDLVQVFRTSDDAAQARRDAWTFATLCSSLADQIEYDGQLSQPRLRTGVQLDDLRRWAREYRLEGRSFSAEYPALPQTVRDFLDSQVGTAGGPIDAAQRTRWITALRTLSRCAAYAGDVL